MALVSLLAMLLATAQPSPRPHVVRGVVRASDSGEPVVGALIRALSEGGRAYSDSVGAYAVQLSGPGAHRIQVSRTGYESLTLDVIAGTDTSRVDFALTPSPLRLAPTSILATALNSSVRDQRPTDVPQVGTRLLERAWLSDHFTSASPDALAALTSLPDVRGRSGTPASLHVRGGSADQNVVLLDDVPVFNPYHGGGTLSAVSAEVVSSVTLHAGVAPARYGNAASAVVALETDTSVSRRVTSRGSVSESAISQAIETSIPGVGGSLLMSARQSVSGLPLDLDGGAARVSSSRFRDLFAKVTRPLGGGRLEAFTFQSVDALAFNTEPSISSAASEITATAEELRRNHFDWATHATALIWGSRAPAPTRWQIKGWHSGFVSDASWAADSGALGLRSGLTSTGVGLSMGRSFGELKMDAGLESERLWSRYALAALDSIALGDCCSRLAYAGARITTSLFAEAAWPVSSSWSFRVGAREQPTGMRWPSPEPRLVARFAPTERLAISGGYSRASQDVQSLRNEESLLDVVFGVNLPVMSGRRRVRRAVSDQLTGGIQWQLSRATTLRTDAYGRWMRGLVLVPLATPQPFATAPVNTGRGRASGVTASFEHEGGRLTTELSYGYGVSERIARSKRYSPASSVTHAANAAASYRLWSHTSIRMAMQSEAGRRGNLFAGRVRWAPWQTRDGSADLEGSPQRFIGPLSSRRLPPYARTDFGVRQEWMASPLGLFGSPGRVAVVVAVSNVFGRHNALGLLQETAGSATRIVPMEPRVLRLRLEWGP